ncbi:hypothetical protein K435DRAFT_827494 [Dendrothele bispora CBS 962.96]|uniref:SWI5-dependent HO expression protein 3 n=1 Tax=Dendrothele bispora (strain CBS 962.96) TaxID=1314807 RepID=A0A4S8MIH5_DENBC|nr:hypothetical protein K435DRAFT_827494 [Dendrothele bispora CBS 962.96]
MPSFGSPTDKGLSPLKSRSERSLSRTSSRSSIRSIRSPSPSFSIDNSVAVRNQISTLKHIIRHQQSQAHELENVIRPYADLSETMSMASSPPPPPSSFPANASTTSKISKRSSYEVLQGIAGPESNLPLPRRESLSSLSNGHTSHKEEDHNSIREGIPSSSSNKRTPSPTRTLSRIPVSAVGNARALAEEGQAASSRSVSSTNKPSELDTTSLSPSGAAGDSSTLSATSPSHSSSLALQPPSPSLNSSKRVSLTPGGTTKVLADLQAGVINARNALENTKAQLRLSQKAVAQLTRQTEDLKEGRERLRLENEGLNNVVARKERLLQEVLERARKAESEATALRAQLKQEATTSKKNLREMESALQQSTSLSQKSEREYVTLRESLKTMKESWKNDMDQLRQDMQKREERWKGEAETIGKKYKQLLGDVKATNQDREAIKKLKEEDKRVAKEVEDEWTGEIERLEKEVQKSNKESEEAVETSRQLSAELARLRRLIQNSGRSSSQFEQAPS